jgi:hypothetical protein
MFMAGTAPLQQSYPVPSGMPEKGRVSALRCSKEEALAEGQGARRRPRIERHRYGSNCSRLPCPGRKGAGVMFARRTALRSHSTTRHSRARRGEGIHDAGNVPVPPWRDGNDYLHRSTRKINFSQMTSLRTRAPGGWKEGNRVYNVAAPGCQDANSGQRSQRLILVGQRGVLSQAPNFNPDPMRGRDFTARVKGAIEPYEEIRG